MEKKITFDPQKLKVVPIDSVRPNSWNPKDKETDDFKKVVKSISEYGQRQPVIVRENEGLEIIDGEQRWRACKELNFTEVIVYNEGKMEDKKAQELTLWYQVQVPFNDVSLAGMVVKLVTDFENSIVPYDQAEIDKMKELIKFDWEKYKTDLTPPDDLGDTIKQLVIPMTEEQYKVVHEAFDKLKKAEGDLSDARCIELICVEFINMPSGKTGMGQI